jgi:hypothetical protein
VFSYFQTSYQFETITCFSLLYNFGFLLDVLFISIWDACRLRIDLSIPQYKYLNFPPHLLFLFFKNRIKLATEFKWNHVLYITSVTSCCSAHATMQYWKFLPFLNFFPSLPRVHIVSRSKLHLRFGQCKPAV